MKKNIVIVKRIPGLRGYVWNYVVQENVLSLLGHYARNKSKNHHQPSIFQKLQKFKLSSIVILLPTVLYNAPLHASHSIAHYASSSIQSSRSPPPVRARHDSSMSRLNGISCSARRIELEMVPIANGGSGGDDDYERARLGVAVWKASNKTRFYVFFQSSIASNKYLHQRSRSGFY